MIAVKTYKKQERVDYKSLIVVNKATQNYDPTRTTVLRAQFMKDMDRRFVSLGRLIKKAIIEDDVFGLIEPKHLLVKIINVNTDTPGKEAFKFSTSQDKVSQFMKWLKEQERKGLIQTTTINTLGTPIEKAWTDQYIADSYKRGVTRARYEMGAAGMGTPGIEETGGISASMSTPFHMDRVGMLYARTFEDLKGITAAMDSAISRILSQGMVDGDGPRSLAGKIVDATGISRNRAMTLARTEIIRAHHSAMVQEYKNWAVEGVVVKAEWVTAGFNVCPVCASRENKIYTLDEVEGMIPAHPNCRCIALPTMPEKGVKKVEEVVKPIEEPIRVNSILEAQKLMAKDGDFVKNLSKNTVDIIRDYTGTDYRVINRNLRTGFEADVWKKNPGLYKSKIETLNSFLESAPKVETTTNRFLGVDSSMWADYSKLKKGELYTDPGFMSTTYATDYGAAGGEFGEIKLIIKGKNGVLIESLSGIPQEKEVLFKTNSVFKVTDSKIKKKPTQFLKGKMEIYLEEI